MTLTAVVVAAVAAGILLLGWLITRPAPIQWRWLARATLGATLFALLTPAGVISTAQDWLRNWLPLAASASQAPGADWVVHLLSFAALAALLFHVRRDLPAWVLAVGLIGLGALTEALQFLVDGRQAAISDLVADSAGVLAGWLIAAFAGHQAVFDSR